MKQYRNGKNPFNDANLESKFVWKKKKQRDKRLGIRPEDEERRKRETVLELEKLRKLREEREREMEVREREKTRQQIESDLQQLGDWEAKESEFYLEQAKKRAEIRIKQKRPKPIDLLAISLKLSAENEVGGEDEEILQYDLEDPAQVFLNLSPTEVEQLHQDIQMYLTLEKDEANLEFWRAMIVVAEDEVSKLKQQQQGARPTSRIPAEVSTEIDQLLQAKTLDELNELQLQVQQKLASKEPIDVEYWERLLKSIVVWKAKARLRDMHSKLKARKRRKRLSLNPNYLTSTAASAMQLKQDPYDPCMSPQLRVEIGSNDRYLEIVDAAEEMAKLIEQRKRVDQRRAKRRQVVEKAVVTSDELFFEQLQREERMEQHPQHFDDELYEEDEEAFNVEAALQKTTYQWEDKHRPRKPRYFNRVHTGFEWNKYNQTHYDHDNPPPKVVQGYKFNIFYPDLIDKSKAPSYRLEKEASTDETVLIRFSAGPPYEDIAFRIVNREWEFSHKKGFKSKFEHGVLQLHFRFRRYYYRR